MEIRTPTCDTGAVLWLSLWTVPCQPASSQSHLHSTSIAEARVLIPIQDPLATAQVALKKLSGIDTYWERYTHSQISSRPFSNNCNSTPQYWCFENIKRNYCLPLISENQTCMKTISGKIYDQQDVRKCRTGLFGTDAKGDYSIPHFCVGTIQIKLRRSRIIIFLDQVYHVPIYLAWRRARMFTIGTWR